MNKKIILIIATVFLSFFGYANADTSDLATINGRPGTYLHVMASYAPLDYVSGGIVSIRDSRGKLIAKGETNTRGAFRVPLELDKFKNLPLRVTVTGGKIISHNGDLYVGPKFKGHLKGQITEIPLASSTSIYLDLVTTSASVLASRYASYDIAFNKVRESLDIESNMSMSVLRYANSYVGNSEVKRGVFGAKGYDRFIKSLSRQIRNNEKINWLKPSSESWNQMVLALSDAHLGSDSAKNLAIKANKEPSGSYALASDASVVCAASVPNGKGGLSTQAIIQFGVLAAKDLMAFVKIPGGGIVEGITGLLLSGISTGQDPTLSAIQRVQEQLACISTQITELQKSINTLAFTEAVKNGLPCRDTADNQYTNYRDIVEGAMPKANGGTTYKLDSSDPELKKTVDGWGPTSRMMDICDGGKTVNSMLFGDGASGEDPAWHELNKKLQGEYIWYTQLETQQLQAFLSYWSTVTYQVFVLSNEYYNYYGMFEKAEDKAGADPEYDLLCAPDATSESKTYCVWMSNINNAFPPDLYSDEIAIPDTGNAVAPFPAGLAIGVGELGLNLSYIVKHSNKNGEYYASEAAKQALQQWNGKVVLGGSSVVESFDNPKTIRVNAYENDYWRLTSNNPDGSSAAAFFLDAISKAPTSDPKWDDLKSKDVSFWAYDQWSHFVAEDILDQTLVALGSIVNREEVWADCVPEDYDYFGPTECRPNQPPVMGVLLGRTWWEGAGAASTYEPPPPPTRFNSNVDYPGPHIHP